jgi:putative transposase
MSRKLLIRCAKSPYHVTVRSNNREWFDLSKDLIWEILSKQLATAVERYNVKVHALVLMDNHLHMLVTTPDQNLDALMRHLLTKTSLEIGRRAKRINHAFGGRYKWTIIYEKRYFLQAYKYVYRNPIKAGLCQAAENYPWSTLPRVLARLPLSFPIEKAKFTPSFWSDETAHLEYINEDFGEKKEEEVRRALRRRIYEPPNLLK